jgi:hypothetical protein
LADGYPSHKTEKKLPKKSSELSVVSRSIHLPAARSLTGRSLPLAAPSKNQALRLPHSIRITEFDQSLISQDISKNSTLR